MNGRRRPHDVDVDVRVVGGMVRGVRERGLLAWRGIPYAAPPVRQLRFAPPAEVVPWSGTRDASEYGAIAPQSFSNRLIRPPSLMVAADEDCLTVNVHAPSDAGSSSPLPVMVFIHGGGYSSGSSRDFSGRGAGFVSSGRVVYVSFNYRLGALGYLDFT
ncbi:MAG TPA: carboxylesterase family protein, partial [Agromyces sp.]